RVLFALSDGSEGEGPAMTATEAQDYANRGMTRWAPVAAALSPLQTQSASPQGEGSEASSQDEDSEASSQDEDSEASPQSEGNEATPDSETEGEAPADDDVQGDAPSDSEAPVEPVAAEDTFVPDAALVANIRAWRSETQHGQAHVDRWTRVLIAFKVETGSLAPMSAAEAQTYLDKGWTRWEPVVTALKSMQADTQQAAASEQNDTQATTEQDEAPQATDEENEPAPTEQDEAPAAEDEQDEPVTMAQGDEPAPTPALSVSDASGAEGSTIKFTITLAPAATDTVSVWVSTRESQPVSAHKNRDYQHNGEWLTFKPGETRQHHRVYTLDDAHDDSGETFELVLSQARGAVIADAVGVGTIMNDDPLPAAHLARFGRTVAEHALGGIAGRLEAPRAPGLRGVFAGRAFSAAPGSKTGHRRRSGGGTGAPNGLDGFHTPGGGVGVNPSSRRSALAGDLHSAVAQSLDAQSFDTQSPDAGASMTARAVLLGSSFTLTRAADGAGGSLAFWGRAAQSHFDGVDRGHGTDVTLNGKVTTAMLGADYARGDWLVGLALTETASTGGYSAAAGNPCMGEIGAGAMADTMDSPPELCATDGPGAAAGLGATAGLGAGEVESSLTAVIPYATRRVAERLTLWGATGYGRGAVTLTPGAGETLTGDAPLSADTDFTLAAVGLRGDLLAPVGFGPALALTSDALWTRTTSAGTHGLLASASAVTRLRLGLEGSWALDFAGARRVTPTLAVGARHDGGDAETGFGIELGGGVQWIEPRLGLTLDISARTLLAHGDDDIKDRGVSAALTFDPAPGTPFGPRLSLRQDFGGPAQGGLDALFRPETPQPRHGAQDAARWTLEADYGLPALQGRFSARPLAGIGRAGGVQDYHLGWQLTPAAAHAPDISFSARAVRRVPARAAAEHGIELRLNWQW
ncbi:MAG: hypothetical protein OXF58_08695, partial [Gammaproteobacteria bacterium]|nr:hypothetical protein [Gammaproteobacteria bacterium]